MKSCLAIDVVKSKSGNKYMRKILYISCSNIITIIGRTKQENNIEIYYKKNVMKVNIITQP